MTTHAIDGAPVDALASLVRVNLFGPPTFSGGDVRLPYRPGERFGSRTRRGRTYATTWRLTAATEGAWNDRAQAFVDLVTNDGQVFTLTRTRAGAGGPVTESAQAVYLDGGDVVREGAGDGAWMGIAVVAWRLLDGRFA